MAGVKITNRAALRALQRLEREAPGATHRGLHRAGLILGRRISERIISWVQFSKQRRLARSFLIPEAVGDSILLGRSAPLYAAIHEYGGVIRAKRAPFLVFEHPPGSGEWHSVKQVTIREKRFARGAIEERPLRDRMVHAVAVEIERAFTP